MYNKSNPWKFKQIFSMPEKCPVCSQKYELEMGFWYGTGYVSYALSVALSVSSFVAWWVLIGMSTQDTRFFWWLGSNIALLLVLQPWLMRLSRVIYLYFFVSYTEDFDTTPTKEFDNG
jgi:hypothetical protein